jgi:hypothetical protein
MSEPTHASFDQLDPGAVARTDRFIDALANREPVEFGDVVDQGAIGDRELSGLLEDWRDELRVPAASGLCPEPQAVEALHRGLARRRHSHRRMALLGAVAAAILGIGGFGALVAGAQPGEPLYGIHTMMFGETPSVHDERIARSAQSEMDLVEQMISMGQWDQAQDKLATVSDRVQKVKDGDRKQDLIDRVNRLNTKVASRDPSAAIVPDALPSAAPAVSVPAPATQPDSVGG